jgi:hypothetical protein
MDVVVSSCWCETTDGLAGPTFAGLVGRRASDLLVGATSRAFCLVSSTCRSLGEPSPAADCDDLEDRLEVGFDAGV